MKVPVKVSASVSLAQNTSDSEYTSGFKLAGAGAEFMTVSTPARDAICSAASVDASKISH